MTSRPTPRLVAFATLAFAAQLWAQVLWTPVGEGMDVYGHLAYIGFVAREGRAPTPVEPSVRRDLAAFRDACLTNAYLCPDAYSDWRAASVDERRARAAALTPAPEAPYVEANYQAQHPPAYYWLMALPWRLVASRGFDVQVTVLSLVSASLTALAVPAIVRIFLALMPWRAAMLSTLALAWFPNLLPFLARVTNDTLAFPVAAWLVAVMAGAVRTRHPIRWAALLLALGCWTKTYFFTFVPVFVVWAAIGTTATVAVDVGAAARRVGTAVGWLAVLIAPLLALNLVASGQLLPLVEAQRTAGEPLTAKIVALFTIDVYWFVAGLARNFFWSGYWSFVSPHYLFYLPLALPLVVAAATRPSWADLARRLREVWLHVAIAGFFLAGLWWHAALFSLDAARHGHTVHSGNEGYYALVILPSVLVAVFWPWCAGASTAAALRTLRAVVVASIAWNLVARVAMGIFWGGTVPLAGRERLMDAGASARALVDPHTWTTWWSLPGVVPAAPWLAIVLMAVAIALTWRILSAIDPSRPVSAGV